MTTRCDAVAANGYSQCARESGHDGDHEVNEAPGRHVKWPHDKLPEAQWSKDHPYTPGKGVPR